MAGVKIRTRIDDSAVQRAFFSSVAPTTERLYQDMRKSEVSPFRTGATQETAKRITQRAGKYEVRSRVQHVTPYSKFIYYRTTIPFSRYYNRNAGPLWWRFYLLGGRKHRLIQQIYVEELDSRL